MQKESTLEKITDSFCQFKKYEITFYQQKYTFYKQKILILLRILESEYFIINILLVQLIIKKLMNLAIFNYIDHNLKRKRSFRVH